MKIYFFFVTVNYENLTEKQGIEVKFGAHRRVKEAEYIDYFGQDSFCNIEQQPSWNTEQHLHQYHPTQISSNITTTTTQFNSILTLTISTTTISQNITQLPPTTSLFRSSTSRTTSSRSAVRIDPPVS